MIQAKELRKIIFAPNKQLAIKNSKGYYPEELVYIKPYRHWFKGHNSYLFHIKTKQQL